MNIARYLQLRDENLVNFTDYALTNGTAVYSESIYIAKNIGFCTLFVKEDKAGGGGDVDISAEYSIDATNWYTAYRTDMAGTITAEGNIVTALQNVERWIHHPARLAIYMRYKFDPDADSQISAKFIYQDN